MYIHPIAMKRLQIMIEGWMDEALEGEASRRETSKAALIREYVGDNLKPLPPIEEDPLWQMVGMVGDDDYEPDGRSIDDVVYG